jgi:sporulation protein YlmC with PRC-barrel domain
MRHLAAMTVAGFALSVLLATEAFGFWTENEEGYWSSREPREWTTMDTGFRVSQMLGRTIWNTEKQELGSITELVIAENGRITYAILNRGAKPWGHGVGDEVVAVPWSAVAMNTKDRTLTLDISKEKMRRAPTFKKGQWDRLENPAFTRTVHGYYGVEEGFNEHGALHGSYKASKFMGTVVKNLKGEELGYIHDMIAGTDGRIKYVIVSQGGGVFGIGSKRLPVPWSAMTFDAEHFSGVLDMDREVFSNAPNIAGSNWRIFDDPNWEKKVRKFYGVEQDQ